MKPPADQPVIKPVHKSQSSSSQKRKLELDSKNMRMLLIAGLALLVVAFMAVMLLGLSTLSSKSQALVDLRSKSQSADDELLNLQQSKKDVEKYAYFKDVAKTVIPNDKDQAQAVLEIFQFAQNAGIQIQSITFPNSNLGLSTSSLGGAADATAAKSTSSAITQAKPVTGIPGLYSLELTITPQTSNTLPASLQVTYPKILTFLKSIENNRRTAEITRVDIQPPTGTSPYLSFTLTVNIFIKP